jgi:hypothetical protein
MFLTINISVKYTVITTFNQAGLDTYGQRMIDTFEQYWPASVDLIIYAENCQPRTSRGNTKVLDIFQASESCRSFVNRHQNNPEANGGKGPHNQHLWSEKKQFKWQAVRFCYKVFAVGHAIATVDSDWVVWIDADSHTHSEVTEVWLDSICPQTSLASYLGRSDNYHSECGWVAYNRRHQLTEQFARDFTELYEQDQIFNYGEWHDSYIWDIVRKKYRDTHGAYFYNLNPEPDTKGLAGHPFINSELGRVMDHIKGKRKSQGHSRAKEVVLHHDVPYWRRLLGLQ